MPVRSPQQNMTASNNSNNNSSSLPERALTAATGLTLLAGTGRRMPRTVLGALLRF